MDRVGSSAYKEILGRIVPVVAVPLASSVITRLAKERPVTAICVSVVAQKLRQALTIAHRIMPSGQNSATVAV
jgi:hypothetical protein